MTRILVVTNLWPENGSFRGIFVQEQVQALRRLGYTVDVEVIAQSRGRGDYLRAVPRVRALVRTGGYDLVHVHYGLAALAARFAGPVPRVLTLHGSDIQVPWQARMTRLGRGGTAARIYVSRRLADAARDPDGVVIPGGVDVELFAPVDRLVARRRLGLPGEGPLALFGGRTGQVAKGYDLFRAVLDELRERGIPVAELLIAAPRVDRAQVPLKFAAADVLLFTSRPGHEGSPTVVKEAVAMGLPVVSTDVGDVAEILADVTPSAVAAWHPAALADAAEPLLRNPVRSDGRRQAGRLSADTAAGRVAQVYERVLASRRRSG
jgi:teichuronic acid biosynthesis glycosyltransferase TuaC